MSWRGINTENSVIRGSYLKGCKPPFWISANLRWHLQDLHEAGQAILLCDYNQERKRWDPTNYSLYGIFDQDWYEFKWKYWRLCFAFCKIEGPDSISRGSWCHQNWHISCCNHREFREQKFPYFSFTFLFVMKIKAVF